MDLKISEELLLGKASEIIKERGIYMLSPVQSMRIAFDVIEAVRDNNNTFSDYDFRD